VAPEDVFLKIDQLHSKKDIKDYLQLMRDEFRKEYMEGIFGGEKANRILNEMEYGLKVHPVETEENGYVEEEPAARMMTRMGYAAAAEDSDGEGEMGSGGNGETETPPGSPPEPVVNPYASNVANVETNPSQNEAGVESTVDLNPNATADKNIDATEDDEDEAEATFEDDNTDKDVGEEEKVGKESDEDMNTDELELVVAKESDKNEGESEFQENEKNEVESEDQNNTLEAMEEQNNDVEEETLTLKESDIKTQESLTLMPSQFDADDDMEFTQDDRFSQVSVMGGVTTETAKPNVSAQPERAEFEEEPQDDFSQTERFSQFTQTQTTGPVFEEDPNAEGEDEEEEDADQLGQTMGDAALSMEY